MCFCSFDGIYLFGKPQSLSESKKNFDTSGLHDPIFRDGFEGADFAHVDPAIPMASCVFWGGFLLGNGPAVTFSTPISVTVLFFLR